MKVFDDVAPPDGIVDYCAMLGQFEEVHMPKRERWEKIRQQRVDFLAS